MGWRGLAGTGDTAKKRQKLASCLRVGKEDAADVNLAHPQNARQRLHRGAQACEEVGKGRGFELIHMVRKDGHGIIKMYQPL